MERCRRCRRPAAFDRGESSSDATGERRPKSNAEFRRAGQSTRSTEAVPAASAGRAAWKRSVFARFCQQSRATEKNCTGSVDTRAASPRMISPWTAAASRAATRPGIFDRSLTIWLCVTSEFTAQGCASWSVAFFSRRRLRPAMKMTNRHATRLNTRHRTRSVAV